jgi:hypothetical protein
MAKLSQEHVRFIDSLFNSQSQLFVHMVSWILLRSGRQKVRYTMSPRFIDSLFNSQSQLFVHMVSWILLRSGRQKVRYTMSPHSYDWLSRKRVNKVGFQPVKTLRIYLEVM